jgi:hypothetical protein
MKEICTRQDHPLDMWVRWDPHQTTWRCVATLDAMGPRHITNPRKHTFDQSGASTRIQGPHPHENKLKTPHTHPYTPEDPPGSHLDERRCKRTHPGVGRTPIRPNPSEVLSSSVDVWQLSIGSSRHPEVFWVVWHSEQATPLPINRRGGVGNETHSTHPRLLS